MTLFETAALAVLVGFLTGHVIGRRPKSVPRKVKRELSGTISPEDYRKLGKAIENGATRDEAERYARKNCRSFPQVADRFDEVYKIFLK